MDNKKEYIITFAVSNVTSTVWIESNSEEEAIKDAQEIVVNEREFDLDNAEIDTLDYEIELADSWEDN